MPALLIAIALMLLWPRLVTRAQESAAQFFMRGVNQGVQTGGRSVLQAGFFNSISAAVATNTTTQVVAAPASGSIYLRGIYVEKMTNATGLVNVISGTGSNCGTGTTTLFSYSMAAAQVPQLGEFNVNILLPAATALCLQTDGATTSARALYN